MRLEPRQAVQVARRALSEYFEGHLDNVQLEELSRDEDRARWFITLGYDLHRPSQLDRVFGLPGKVERVYKVFEIDDKIGDVVQMSIRE